MGEGAWGPERAGPRAGGVASLPGTHCPAVTPGALLTRLTLQPAFGHGSFILKPLAGAGPTAHRGMGRHGRGTKVQTGVHVLCGLCRIQDVPELPQGGEEGRVSSLWGPGQAEV